MRQEHTRSRWPSVHDLAEAVVDDITPSDARPSGMVVTLLIFRITHTSTEEKHLRKRLGFKQLSCLAKRANPEFADEITSLWSEFEAGTSRAAKLVFSVDAIKCIDQALIYEKRHAANLEEFMELVSKLAAPELKDWIGHLKREREAVWSHASSETPTLFVLGMVANGQLRSS
ncbi:hypothetical protein KC365_g15531 [Hortaea werneckii]|nr:hypothetical protein KC365_g15531 [Hortaea werneckii]